ncbi:hypothetical protein AB4084_07145 [Lysobacter sp. 2RAB21]
MRAGDSLRSVAAARFIRRRSCENASRQAMRCLPLLPVYSTAQRRMNRARNAPHHGALHDTPVDRDAPARTCRQRPSWGLAVAGAAIANAFTHVKNVKSQTNHVCAK